MERLARVEEWRSALFGNGINILDVEIREGGPQSCYTGSQWSLHTVLAYLGDVNPWDVKTYGAAAKASTKEMLIHGSSRQALGLFNQTFYSAEIGKLRMNLHQSAILQR